MVLIRNNTLGGGTQTENRSGRRMSAVEVGETVCKQPGEAFPWD